MRLYVSFSAPLLAVAVLALCAGTRAQAQVSASYWFSKHWAIQGSGRGFAGTSGAAPNDLSIKGPFVSEYFFTAGPEWLGPHNKHGAILAHLLVGGAYGKFEQDLRGNPPSAVDFYNDQIAPAAIIGGHFDLNHRSVMPQGKVSPEKMQYRIAAFPWVWRTPGRKCNQGRVERI